ncbi:hypothetical protein B6S59_25465 [Pseudomonas sp. A46]|nr:phage BR0599 family protein [Pseudomonas sp. A46]OWJ91123.1 hypothetical protein B6S59_25465 [Pseudomonas sp. A46]
MSFDSRERSLDAGVPIRLYQFSRGVLRWLYNTSDRDITWNNQVFRSVIGGISDNGIRQTGVSAQDAFVVNAPADIEVAQLFRVSRPSAEISLKVFDLHYGDAEAICRYVGSIASVKWPTLDSCTINCQDIESSMERPGLIDTYSLTCTTTLYSNKCKVDRNLHRVETTIQGLAGLTISAADFASYPDGWFNAGYIEWSIGSGEYDTRHVESHVGSDLTLLGGSVGLQIAQAIRAYPGCDFLAQTCHDKYGNLDNHRGANHMDGKSPFDGEQVF